MIVKPTLHPMCNSLNTVLNAAYNQRGETDIGTSPQGLMTEGSCRGPISSLIRQSDPDDINMRRWCFFSRLFINECLCIFIRWGLMLVPPIEKMTRL